MLANEPKCRPLRNIIIGTNVTPIIDIPKIKMENKNAEFIKKESLKISKNSENADMFLT